TFDRERARELARDAIAEYAIRARSEDARAVELSGGNIQKLLVARAMAQARVVGGRLLVATNPTRGLDVRATEFVRHRGLAFAASGGGLLLVSGGPAEVDRAVHRLGWVFRGTICADL